MIKEEKDILQKTQRILNWNRQKLYYNTAKKHQRYWIVKRGEVCFVDLGENIGSEENFLRPCLVIQSNSYNYKSPVFTCAIISTSKVTIPDIQIEIKGNYSYVDEKGNNRILSGAIDLGQIKTIGKERIINNIGMIGSEMNEVDEKLINAFGLSSIIIKRDNIIKSLEGKIKFLQSRLIKAS